MNFIIITTISNLILGIVWSKSSWPNFLIKLGLFSLGVWGIFLIVMHGQLPGWVTR